MDTPKRPGAPPAAASRRTLPARAAFALMAAAAPAAAFAVAPAATAAAPEQRLAPAIEAFFGNLRGDYVAASPRVARQFEAVFFAARPAVAWVDGHGLLATANRHEPPELAALALDTDGSIEAAALVSFHCRAGAPSGARRRGPAKAVCAYDPLHPALDIFVYRPREGDPVVGALSDWARQAEIRLRHRKPWPTQLHVQIQNLQVVRAP